MSTDPTPSSDSPEPAQSSNPHADDCFAPPKEPCECYCLHCERTFTSDGIWFQKVINARDGFDGFWMCPTPNCGGAGFLFDIFPTDPNHPANQGSGGWTFSDDGYNPDEEDQETQEYDPEEPRYAQLDEELGDDEDDDLEGEEWKHGLEPGERLPEPSWVTEARKRQEEEQARYNAPDERPRVIDWSEKELPSTEKSGPFYGPSNGIDENDIPF